MRHVRSGGKFQSILKGIQVIIEEDNLRPGDRLPSERELSERLGAGRSSIREALRALELLGLIVTRQGEGTFLQPYHTNQFVQLLADFILRDNKSRRDLLEMRILLELEGVRLAAQRATKHDLNSLQEWIERMEECLHKGLLPLQPNDEFHHLIIQMSQNGLLLRTWIPVYQYFSLCYTPEQSVHQWEKAVEELKQVLQAMRLKDSLQAYQRLRKHLEQFLLNSLS